MQQNHEFWNLFIQIKTQRFKGSATRCQSISDGNYLCLLLKWVSICECSLHLGRLFGQIERDSSNGKIVERTMTMTTTSTCQHLPPNRHPTVIHRTPSYLLPMKSRDHHLTFKRNKTSLANSLIRKQWWISKWPITVSKNTQPHVEPNDESIPLLLIVSWSHRSMESPFDPIPKSIKMRTTNIYFHMFQSIWNGYFRCSYICPFCQCFCIFVPWNLYAYRIPFHLIEFSILRCGTVEKFTPQQLAV